MSRRAPIYSSPAPVASEDGGFELDTWTRPSDWLSLPAFSTTREIIMLFAVWDTPTNFCAFRCAGNYTVDWGDGSATENVASGVTAQHNYAYANAASLTSEGFKQVVIRVIGNSATLNTLNTTFKHSGDSNTGTSSTYGFLEIKAKEITSSLVIGTSTTTNGHIPRHLQNVELHSSSTSNFQNTFYNCIGLQRVWTDAVPSGPNCDNCFRNTNSLRVVEGFNGFTIIGANGMFQASGIRVVPTMDLTANCAACFKDCKALIDLSRVTISGATVLTNFLDLATTIQELPTWSLAACTSASNMCGGMSALKAMPLFTNATAITDVSNFAQNNISMRSFPAINFSGATNIRGLVQGCTLLTDMGAINVSSSTGGRDLYANCPSLRTVPSLTTTAWTTMQNMHFNNTDLLAFPTYDMNGVTNISTMCQNCISVRVIPAWDMSTVTTATSCFNGMRSLNRSLATGMTASHDYSNGQLSAASLDEIYTNLGNTTGGTITVTGNYGTTGDTTTIATNAPKSWTVTG